MGQQVAKNEVSSDRKNPFDSSKKLKKFLTKQKPCDIITNVR
jgi:hypothetical protein